MQTSCLFIYFEIVFITLLRPVLPLKHDQFPVIIISFLKIEMGPM